jgi:mannose-1-phosphate guanylyltransferase / mannose-6-phosphate isomerase
VLVGKKMSNVGNNKPEVYPVILCGGSGTRLWPMSRKHFPKQLLRLTSGYSLLQETVGRTSVAPFSAPILICNAEYRFTIAEQLREIDVTPAQIILEPFGRNTAPAVAVAALEIIAEHGDGVLVIMPSDHLVQNKESFLQAAETAIRVADAGALITFGIKARSPETGYGYIQRGDELADFSGSFKIDKFVEKPDATTAAQFIQDDRFTWNSGMFVFKASSYLQELEIHQPAVLAACVQAYEKSAREFDFLRLDEKSFSKSTSISIDYAVMENTSNAVVVPVEMGWSDVGSWDSLYDVGAKSKHNNVELGDVICVNSEGSYIRSEGPLVATVGIRDLVIVATRDAVVISQKDQTQDIKDVVQILEQQGRKEHLQHTRVHRPWGYYQSLDKGDQFQVKRIVVNPGAKLSLQKHQHRAENWVVVSGVATVTKDEDVLELVRNQSIYIPAGTLHRLENKTAQALEIIEVQSGDYLGEDDIVRFDDTYGRSDQP